MRNAACLLVLLAATAVPATGAEHHFEPRKFYFTYSFAHPPALRIQPGDRVVTHTRDASNDVLTPADRTVYPKVQLDAVNPRTGPFFIEGAEPGDTLVVRLESIQPSRDWGWGASIPYFGALAPEFTTMTFTEPAPDELFIWRFDPERTVATLDLRRSRSKTVHVPIRPFLGSIGVAPPGKEAIGSIQPGPHGANMDFRELVAGVTLHFPVFEPGALLFLGDGHAAQGDGEVGGAAIETAMDVSFTVDVIKGKTIAWPRLINQSYIMVIGSARPLQDALRLACVDLVGWLGEDYGFDRVEAVQILGQAARIEVANVVDPNYSVACGLHRRHLSVAADTAGHPAGER